MRSSTSYRRAIEAVACIGDDDPPWADILSTARDLIGADSGSLIMLDNNGGLLHVSHVGLAASTVNAYTGHFHKLDMVTDVAMKHDVGAWLDSDEAIPRQALLHSEFHNDYLLANNQRQILGLVIERTDKRLTAMSFQRSSIEKNARSRLSTGKTATYTRAFQDALRNRQDSIANDIGVLDNTFGSLGESACLVTQGGMVAHLSPGCAELFAYRGGLCIRRGRLHHPDSSTLAYILETIGVTLRTGRRTRAVASAEPGTTISLDIVTVPSRWRMAGEPMALIRLRRHSVDGPVDTAGLVSAFGITPAEARVLAALVAGRSPAEYAREHGVAENTVRKQIANLKSKLNCSRVVDLVRLAIVARG